LIAARPLDVDESAATVPVPSLAVPKGDRTTRHSDYVLAVWEQHRASLYGFAVRVTRNPTVAEDLVQDAFLRLLREVQRSGPPNDPRSWLMRVLANLGVSRARRASVAERLGPRLVNRETGESPEMRIIRKEHGAVLDAALARLGRDERVVLLLAASGFSGREIASAIGRSEGATRTLLCRSRVKVHRLLGEDDG
jgi:RNA polymerase sigma-70 factor (ECF subfamily)